jgi:hypothetical protein
MAAAAGGAGASKSIDSATEVIKPPARTAAEQRCVDDAVANALSRLRSDHGACDADILRALFREERKFESEAERGEANYAHMQAAQPWCRRLMDFMGYSAIGSTLLHYARRYEAAADGSSARAKLLLIIQTICALFDADARMLMAYVSVLAGQVEEPCDTAFELVDTLHAGLVHAHCKDCDDVPGQLAHLCWLTKPEGPTIVELFKRLANHVLFGQHQDVTHPPAAARNSGSRIPQTSFAAMGWYTAADQTALLDTLNARLPQQACGNSNPTQIVESFMA